MPRPLLLKAAPPGFSLVELVSVLIILAILAIGTTRFLTDSATGLASTVDRSELASDARLTVDRLGRAVRDALPRSVRVSGPCLETGAGAGGVRVSLCPDGGGGE